MFDFSEFDKMEFQEVPPPQRSQDRPKLIMNSRGVLFMNAAFLHREKRRTFLLSLSSDGRYVKLRPGEDGDTAFSPKGVITHKDMRDELLAREIALPAVYQMEWNEERGIWAGCSEDLPAPPSARQLLPPKERRGRKKHEKA